MKEKLGKGKMRALAVLLAVALVVTGTNLPFSVGSLQAAAKETETGEVQEQNPDEPDTQEPDESDTQEPDESDTQEPDTQKPEQNKKAKEAQAEGDGQEEDPAQPATPLSLEDSGITGKGTEAEPYQIGTKENLTTFRDYVNAGGVTEGKYFSLTETIKANFSDANEWAPIGTQEHPFEGIFLGVADRSKYLSLTTSTIDTGDVALFGVNNGTVRDLLLGNGGSSDYSASIGCSQAAHAAGIAITNNGTISNCIINCGVQAKGGAAGIAFENNGRIEGCQAGKPYTDATLGSSGKILSAKEEDFLAPFGGIAGNNNASGTIINCRNYQIVGNNSTDVKTVGRVGGIAGYNAGTIENCENRGDLQAKELGEATNEETGKIERGGLGGIVGVQKSTGVLKDCFSASRIVRIDSKYKSAYSSQYWQGCILGAFEDAAIPMISGTNLADYKYQYCGGTYSHLSNCSEELKAAQRTAFGNISGCSFWWPPYESRDNYVRAAVGLYSNPQHIPFYEDEMKEGPIIEYTPTDEKNTDAYALQAEYAPGITVTTEGDVNITAPRTEMAESVQGEGTKESPYLIGTETDLAAYRDYVNNGGPEVYARLTADITVTDKNWEGIGTMRQPFFGEFDGNGKSVTLNVERSLDSTVYKGSLAKNVTGLFGFNCGTIRNLTVKGSIQGVERVGAVAGVNGDYYYTNKRKYRGAKAYRGVIENCVNEAEVKGNYYVGGIVGMNVGSMDNHLYEQRADGCSQIIGCTNNGIVGLADSMYGGNEIGGIAGYSAAGKIINCQNTAEISGQRGTGGIVGIAGGVVNKLGGDLRETYYKVIQNCENTGNVKFLGNTESLSYSNIGAIAGAVYDNSKYLEVEITDVFVDCRYTMDNDTNYKLPGVGKEELKQYEGCITYTDNTTPVVPIAPEEFKNGTGTEEDPYLIEGLNNFLYFAQNHEAGTYYKLTEDVDLKGSEKNQWTPIGGGEKPFEGTLDGDGHTIKGLYIDKSKEETDSKDNQGLFGINKGTIKNLTVEGNVVGDYDVGGIVGVNDVDAMSSIAGFIENCTSRVNVTGLERAGGIAGTNRGKIKESESSGTVTGNHGGGRINKGGLGGIAGINEIKGQITSCTNRGKVAREGEPNKGLDEKDILGVGGIVGWQDNGGDDPLKDNVNYGAVSGKKGVGGIVGTSKGSVQNNTNNGTVSGESQTGGIVGNHVTGYGGGADYIISGNNNNGNVTYTGGTLGESYSDSVGGVAV